MMRRMAVGGVTAAMLLVLLAACGGSEASPSPSAEASAPAPATAPTTAPATEAPLPDESAEPVEATIRLRSLCAGVAIRKGPGTDGPVLGRVSKGARVRVVETVAGEAYAAGSCGSSGSDWLKIDRVAGKSASGLYGVPYVYAAAGFFE